MHNCDYCCSIPGVRLHVCTCLLTPRLPPGKPPLFLWTVGVCHCDEKQLSAQSSRVGSVTLGKSLWKPEEAKPVTSIVKSRGWGGWTWVQFPEAMLRGEGRSQPCVPPVPGIQYAFLASVGTRHACGVRAYMLAKHPHTLICKRVCREQALAQAPAPQMVPLMFRMGWALPHPR